MEEEVEEEAVPAIGPLDPILTPCTEMIETEAAADLFVTWMGTAEIGEMVGAGLGGREIPVMLQVH